MASQKNLKIRLDLLLKVPINEFKSKMRLINSAMRAVFRTSIVAGFFLALRKGLEVFTRLREAVRSTTAEFSQLRLKAAETAAIVSGGGSGFSSAMQEALDISRRLSTQTSFSATQIQEGLITAARSGLELGDSLKVTGSALKLAQINGEDFQGTLNNLIGVTRAFGVEISDIPAFADALSTAVRKSNASLSGLMEGMKNVSSIASTAFGESRNTVIDTTAALMTLNDAGIQGAKAGTRLRAAFQKLMGGTVRSTAAFTKYGVNIFKADAASQKYLGTLMNGQSAMADAEDKLNKLKNKQFEMVMASRQNTDEYAELMDSIGKVSTELGDLEEGTDNVYRQFTLAGGGLKEFSEILREMSGNVPSEVIGRAFGIRGGEAIMRLLKDAEKFSDFREKIADAMELSEEGISVTDNMYKQFVETALIGWTRIGNTAKAILGSITDGFFDAVQPVLKVIQSTLSAIFDIVENNKAAFKDFFMAGFEALNPILAMVQIFTQKFVKAIGEMQGSGKISMPVLTTDKEGKIQMQEEDITGTGPEKFTGILSSLGKTFNTVLSQALKKLQPMFNTLADIFSEALRTSIGAKTAIWLSLGTTLGKGAAEGLMNAIADKIPSIIDKFAEIADLIKIPDNLAFNILGKDISIPLPSGDNLRAIASKYRESESANASPTEKMVNKTKEAISGAVRVPKLYPTKAISGAASAPKGLLGLLGKAPLAFTNPMALTAKVISSRGKPKTPFLRGQSNEEKLAAEEAKKSSVGAFESLKNFTSIFKNFSSRVIGFDFGTLEMASESTLNTFNNLVGIADRMLDNTLKMQNEVNRLESKVSTVSRKMAVSEGGR